MVAIPEIDKKFSCVTYLLFSVVFFNISSAMYLKLFHQLEYKYIITEYTSTHLSILRKNIN